MRRLTLSLVALVVGVVLWGSTQAQAQVPGVPYQRPGYSPYLNLFRRDAPFYQNYYGLVRPQFQFENQIQNLQRQTQANQTAIAEQATAGDGLPGTGHSFGYFTHSRFFLNNQRGGAPARPGSSAATGNVGGFGSRGGTSVLRPQPAPYAPSTGYGAFIPR